MSQKSVPLHLELRPSRILAALLLAVHGGAAGCVLIVPLPWPMHMVLVGAVLFSLYRTASRRALLASHRAVTRLVWDELGEWVVVFGNGDELPAHLLPDSFVSPLGVVLNLASLVPPGRYAVVILPDSLDRNSFRRLRVRLRLEGVMEPE